MMLDRLPDELLVQILDNDELSPLGILNVSLICRKLNETVRNSIELRYKLELRKCGVQETNWPNSSRTRSVSERMEALQRWDNAWNGLKLEYQDYRELVSHGVQMLNLDSGCYVLMNRNNEFAIVDLTDPAHSNLACSMDAPLTLQWHPIGFSETEDLVCWISDPSQDLLVFITVNSDGALSIFLRTLSSNGLRNHPSGAHLSVPLPFSALILAEYSYVQDDHILIPAEKFSETERPQIVYITLRWRDVMTDATAVKFFDINPRPSSRVECLILIHANAFATTFTSSEGNGIALYRIAKDGHGNITQVLLKGLFALPRLQNELSLYPYRLLGFLRVSQPTASCLRDSPIFQVNNSHGILVVTSQIRDSRGEIASKSEISYINVVVDAQALSKLEPEEENIIPWSTWAPHVACVLAMKDHLQASAAVYGYRALFKSYLPRLSGVSDPPARNCFLALDFNPAKHRGQTTKFIRCEIESELLLPEDFLGDKALQCSATPVPPLFKWGDSSDIYMDDRYIIGASFDRGKTVVFAIHH